MWAVLGADQGEKWPWLEREGDPGRDLGRKVGQTRAGKARRPKSPPELPELPKPPAHFFL